MNILKSPLLFIAVFALAFFILNESFSYYNGIAEAKIKSYQKDKQILRNLTDAQAKNVQILAEVLASNPGVIEGYLKNNPEIIKKNIFPLWEQVKNKKLTHEIHFFKPPAISFVNFSNFKSLGKDVSSVRTDIRWITSSFEPSAHALMCKTYAGYRATHPIYDKNGTMLGGLSLGKKIDWIPSALKEKTQHDSFLVYTKESTKSLAPKYYDDFMKDKQIVGKNILADKTLNVTVKEIQEIDFTKGIQDIMINNHAYTLYTYSIIDFNKKTMGYICTVTELKEFKNHFMSNLFKSFILIIISVLIIVLITRSKMLGLFKEINYIQNITKRIKSRDFSSLHTQEVNSNVSTESLVKLEHDVIEMGLELEKHYILLEDDNREKSQQLIEQLYRDELTGLGNRNALVKDLQNNTDSYLAILNIRNFKEINDAFGFETGNYILHELAVRYEPTAKREGYSVYRVGSDEYVLMTLENTSKSDFQEFIKKIIVEIEHAQFRVEDENIGISVHMYAGICFDETKKLEKAAMALTQAKKDKKELVIYTKKENTKDVQLNNLETINKLTKALSNDGMLVHYQGIVGRDENIHKYEALIRMKDQDKILSPLFFLELSKRTKHYSRITQFVLKSVFEQFKNTNCSLSINLTADDILNTDTISLIKEKMNLCSNPERVVFELVESDDLYSIVEIYDFIQYIKKMGAKIAIDDFGTGYSNFSYMMKIEPDYLKIDGSLIKNLDTDENAKKIVKTIINFASQLGIKTIAEYVHSKEIFEICRDLGIDEFQGYYFSKPGKL
ncbi:MAG: diguanylate cyclase (GGDEF)-like protein [Sulfurimonas sp.]|jgi:diguanylate cyclase (GGDEF)-like protein|uniref:EAL domain-containing protein n=1 Tax=Sulfurimonas sp. TaxID=2022749 RepID=UPI0039E229D6